MKTRLLSMFAAAVAALMFAACSDDNGGGGGANPDDVVYELEVTMPENLENPSVSSLEAAFTNVVSNVTSTVTYTNPANRDTGANDPGSFDPVTSVVSANLKEGTYNIKINATISYDINGNTMTATVRSERENVSIADAGNGQNPGNEVAMTYFNAGTGFVIEEIFFTGSSTVSGDKYNGDNYFKIKNNSDAVLYADKLAILESEFITGELYMRNFKPDLLSTAMTVQAVYVVPGNGTQYPIEPGESFIISDQAMDHTLINTNSFNLGEGVSKFEWIDDGSQDGSISDTDNEAVPNMEKYYSYTASIWLLAKAGNRGYALARMEVDKAAYLSDYTYDLVYDWIWEDMEMEFLDEEKYGLYYIPNSWIIDAVSVSIKNNYLLRVIDLSLDRGFTYCKIDAAEAVPYGTSIRRKVEAEVNGRTILKDTNNSTEDFEPRAVPSLLDN